MDEDLKMRIDISFVDGTTNTFEILPETLDKITESFMNEENFSFSNGYETVLINARTVTMIEYL